MDRHNLIEKTRRPATILGAILLLSGERYLSTAPAHWWLSGAGIVLQMLGVFCALGCLKAAQNNGYARELPSWRLAAIWQGLIVLSSICYFGFLKILGDHAVPETPVAKVLLGLWLVMLVLGSFLGFGVEWAQARNGRGSLAEPGRVRLAAISCLKVGILAITISSLQYAAVKKNIVWDLSYLKTSAVSESTQKLLRDIPPGLEIAVFYPSGHEVLGKVRLYFDMLKAKAPGLSLQYLDVETNPVAAETFKLNRNGIVIVKSGSQMERIDIGLIMSSAKKNLKNLDADFQKALLAATEKRKVIYFSRGHGELTWNQTNDDQGLKSIKLLEGFLRAQNYSLRFFGVSEGAAKEVPTDADAVVIAGGDQPFLPEEVTALDAYVKRGGNVFVLFDLSAPTAATAIPATRDVSHDPMVKWVADMGIEFVPKILANTANYVAATRTEADVWFLFTNLFTSHETVQSLAKNDQRSALITYRSGYLKTRQDLPQWAVSDTVRSLADTFVDENRNFKFDESKSKKESKIMGAVAEYKSQNNKSTSSKGRIVAFANANVISDALIRNQPNLIYFVDGLRWMVGNAKTSGVASTEDDVRIRHTNKEDIAWFYGAVAIVPALVLLAGQIANKRAKRPLSTGKGGAL